MNMVVFPMATWGCFSMYMGVIPWLQQSNVFINLNFGCLFVSRFYIGDGRWGKHEKNTLIYMEKCPISQGIELYSYYFICMIFDGNLAVLAIFTFLRT